MSDSPPNLWGVEELAKYLKYSVATVTSMVSRSPERLPPRLAACKQPRWEPTAVQAWALGESRPVRRNGGRPRQSV